MPTGSRAGEYHRRGSKAQQIFRGEGPSPQEGICECICINTAQISLNCLCQLFFLITFFGHVVSCMQYMSLCNPS